MFGGRFGGGFGRRGWPCRREIRLNWIRNISRRLLSLTSLARPGSRIRLLTDGGLPGQGQVPLLLLQARRLLLTCSSSRPDVGPSPARLRQLSDGTLLREARLPPSPTRLSPFRTNVSNANRGFQPASLLQDWVTCAHTSHILGIPQSSPTTSRGCQRKPCSSRTHRYRASTLARYQASTLAPDHPFAAWFLLLDSYYFGRV